MNYWYRIWAEDIDRMRVSCVIFVFYRKLNKKYVGEGGYWMIYWNRIWAEDIDRMRVSCVNFGFFIEKYIRNMSAKGVLDE